MNDMDAWALVGLCTFGPTVFVLLADGLRVRRERAKERATAEHYRRLMRYLKVVHARGKERDHEGTSLCAECNLPHPCETFRTASGDPGWPAPAEQVLADAVDVDEPKREI
jgi:hypothetical protein